MRAYFFGNFMLSSIQQGLQAQHVTAEMFLQYQPTTKARTSEDKDTAMLYEWALEHKTTYLMNGGNQESLDEIRQFFDSMYHPHMGGEDGALPWSAFREDEQSLNCCLTSVGIIVPTYVYELSAESGRDHVSTKLCGINENIWIQPVIGDIIEHELTGFEIQLAEKLKQYRYAI